MSLGCWQWLIEDFCSGASFPSPTPRSPERWPSGCCPTCAAKICCIMRDVPSNLYVMEFNRLAHIEGLPRAMAVPRTVGAESDGGITIAGSLVGTSVRPESIAASSGSS